jgi:hypothetical protein
MYLLLLSLFFFYHNFAKIQFQVALLKIRQSTYFGANIKIVGKPQGQLALMESLL